MTFVRQKKLLPNLRKRKIFFNLGIITKVEYEAKRAQLEPIILQQ
jgi:hypothetical protein